MAITITPEIIASFRASCQGLAFSDDTKWPDSVVECSLCEGDVETGGKGWGTYVDECYNFKLRGMYYFAAHWLAITYPGGTAQDPTNIPPDVRLNVSSKSVRDETVSFRDQAITSAADNWLTTSNYGVQYLRLRRRSAMGARAV